jgi:EpsI family protein
MDKRNFLIVLSVLVFVSAVSIGLFLSEKRISDTVSVSGLPFKIGAWIGKDIKLDDREYELLETRNLVMRNYSDPEGNEINLYIIYSQANRRVVHPPEICMQGDGAMVLSKGIADMGDGMIVNKFVLGYDNGKRIVLYWYKAGDLSTASYLKQQFMVSWNRLCRKKVSTAMIRVTMPELKAGEQATDAVLAGFINDLKPLLNVYVP